MLHPHLVFFYYILWKWWILYEIHTYRWILMFFFKECWLHFQHSVDLQMDGFNPAETCFRLFWVRCWVGLALDVAFLSSQLNAWGVQEVLFPLGGWKAVFQPHMADGDSVLFRQSLCPCKLSPCTCTAQTTPKDSRGPFENPRFLKLLLWSSLLYHVLSSDCHFNALEPDLCFLGPVRPLLSVWVPFPVA